jgi:putative hydrolase of the HAD superfamily
MIRAVTFDCWGTLIQDLDFASGTQARIADLAAVTGLERDAAEDLFRRAATEHHNSWVGGVQFGAEGIAAYISRELGITDHLQLDRITEAIEEAGRKGKPVALDGAPDTLRALREAGIRTALVCDTGLTPGRVVRDFLDDAGCLENLEFCAFSNEVGVPKPDARIFHAALEAIDTKPDEAVHVVDLLRTDIEGGRALGMKTIRIRAVNDDLETHWSFGDKTDRELQDADYVVASHAEMIPALKELGAEI